jgi:hypothetical protein
VQAIVDAISVTKPPIDPDDGDIFVPGQEPPKPAPHTSRFLLLFLTFLEKQMANAPQGDLGNKLLTDLPKLFAFIRNPVVQKLLGGGAVTLDELAQLPIDLVATLTGQTAAAPLQLPAPDTQVKTDPPAASAPPTPAPVPTPTLQRPTVMSGVIGTVLSLALTYFGKGLIPPGVGEALVAGSAGTAAIGATGFFETVGKGFSDFLAYRRSKAK